MHKVLGPISSTHTPPKKREEVLSYLITVVWVQADNR